MSMKKWTVFSALFVAGMFFVSVSCVSAASVEELEKLAQGCMKRHKVGQTGKAPDLTKTPASKEEFLKKMQEFKDEKSGIMKKQADKLSTEEISQLGDYFHSKK